MVFISELFIYTTWIMDSFWPAGCWIICNFDSSNRSRLLLLHSSKLFPGKIIRQRNRTDSARESLSTPSNPICPKGKKVAIKVLLFIKEPQLRSLFTTSLMATHSFSIPSHVVTNPYPHHPNLHVDGWRGKKLCIIHTLWESYTGQKSHFSSAPSHSSPTTWNEFIYFLHTRFV